MTDILGKAALLIVLLCVGANIGIRAMTTAKLPTLLSIAEKMVIFPFAAAGVCITIGLDSFATLIAMIFGAVPTAAGAYTLAREMGGDAPAMAAMVTIQTAVSFVTLPLTLSFARMYFGAWASVRHNRSLATNNLPTKLTSLIGRN